MPDGKMFLAVRKKYALAMPYNRCSELDCPNPLNSTLPKGGDTTNEYTKLVGGLTHPSYERRREEQTTENLLEELNNPFRK